MPVSYLSALPLNATGTRQRRNDGRECEFGLPFLTNALECFLNFCYQRAFPWADYQGGGINGNS